MIFISYAHRDGADLAQRIHRDLTSEHLDPWLDTTRLTSGASWTNVIEEKPRPLQRRPGSSYERLLPRLGITR